MKWLRDNWTKVVLIVLLIFLGFMWRNSIENRRDYKAKVEMYETDISLRNDSIGNLKERLSIEQIKSDSILKINDELDKKIENQEKVIAEKDKELEAEKKKIKELPATEQIELLAKNLSKELNEDIDLTMKTSKGDTLIDMTVKQIEVVNTVFVERNIGKIKLIEMDNLLVSKDDKIDNLDLLVLSKENSIELLNETIEQKDGIIATNDELINTMKKDARKKKVKNFFIGLGTGAVTTAVVILTILASGS